jgi:S-adenosyl-L-methionine hydrolase (adenosine-forming)
LKAVITLLTDFGIQDPFVAEMKGVILSICPDATLVDISHDIGKFNIRMGAFVLASATRYFPSGAIHIAVVDPGVGSSRRPILVETKRSLYVGPDNGLLIPAAAREGIRHVYVLTNRSLMKESISATFHGRDVFAPVAAHLALGIAPKETGAEIMDYAQLSFSEPKFDRRSVICEVSHIDGFGNVVTNIPEGLLRRLDLSGKLLISLRRRRLNARFVSSYSELRDKELGVLVGSHGFVEMAYREVSAAKRIGAKIGDPLRVRGG